MKIGSKSIWAAVAVMALGRAVFGAEETNSVFKTSKEKESYAIGMNIGNSIKNGSVDLDLDVMLGAIKDVLAGKEPKLTDVQARDAMNEYRKDAQAKREETRLKNAEKNKKEGEAFLAENKKKPGVKTKTVTLPDGTSGEMQYKVITDGTGPVPGSNDTVSVNYKGTLINGKEFDSSAKHGEKPAKFNVKGVIPAWTEALLMMKTGSKWELYVPSSLAYKDFGSGPMIEPVATLIFEVELLGAETPPPPTPPAPLTSDIIRVPSADELKAGSNIQVLKPEDVERLTRAATNAAVANTNKSGKK